MMEKIDITYIPVEDEAIWNKAFIDILSDGLYAYLKDQGLLKEYPERKKKVEALLEETKALTEPPVEQVDYRQVDTSTTLSINPEQSRRLDTSTTLSINPEQSRRVDSA